MTARVVRAACHCRFAIGILKAICAAAVLSALSSFAQDKIPGAVSDNIFITPEEGGPRRFQLSALRPVELRKSPSNDSPALERLQDGAVLSNLGCKLSEAEIWCAVQQLRSRVRGHVPAKYLRPARGPDGRIPLGPNDSVARAKKGDFDANGIMPCAQKRTGPLEQCTFSVARSDGGDATVVATFSNSFNRTLFFAHGVFVSGNPTMSGTGRDMDWSVTDGRHVIRVDDQRYELTDSDIFGR